MHPVLAKAFDDGERLLHEFRSSEPEIAQVIQAISECFKAGGKLFTAGNGGSMADAMHVAEEFTGRFKKERPALPAIALADPTHLTCVSNDYGFEFVFSRPIEALGKPGDVVLLLTTSGNSENLIKAAQSARAKNCLVVGFLGKGGGKLNALCDIAVIAPGESSDRIQELHMFALHAIIEAVEIELGYE
ncbi:MAG: SIS domain-containing protein [Fimbriimonadaceae bacterium]